MTHRGHDRMLVGFTNTYASQSCAKGWWFSPGLPVSSTNKTDHHNITEILLKVALNTIKQPKKQAHLEIQKYDVMT